MSGFRSVIGPAVTQQPTGAETYFRLTIWESLRAAARAITPDMSLPLLVRLLPARL